MSVSISTRSCGNAFATPRSISALRNVTMPENEMKNPAATSFSATSSDSVYECRIPRAPLRSRISTQSSVDSRLCTMIGLSSFFASAMCRSNTAICVSRGECM